jgi:hypothetical protein
MDSKAGDGKTLKKDVCQAFTMDNTKDGHDFTAMKANWLSKPDLAKKVGSLVIWLKSKLAAEHLLQSGDSDLRCNRCVLLEVGEARGQPPVFQLQQIRT